MRNDGKITQIGIVVKDIDKCVKYMYDKLGVGPWRLRTYNDKQGYIEDYYVGDDPDNKEFSFRVAVCNWGGIQLEYLQPLSGASMYWKWIEKHGEGIHHFKYTLPSDDAYEDAVKAFKDEGYACLCEGKTGPDRYYFPDMEDEVGFLLEIGNGAPVKSFPYTTYPEGLTID